MHQEFVAPLIAMGKHFKMTFGHENIDFYASLRDIKLISIIMLSLDLHDR